MFGNLHPQNLILFCASTESGFSCHGLLRLDQKATVFGGAYWICGPLWSLITTDNLVDLFSPLIRFPMNMVYCRLLSNSFVTWKYLL